MSQVLITLKPGADNAEFEKVKKEAADQGEIVHESKLIKSITVKFKPDTVHTFATNDHYTVEEDKEVRIQ